MAQKGRASGLLLKDLAVAAIPWVFEVSEAVFRPRPRPSAGPRAAFRVPEPEPTRSARCCQSELFRCSSLFFSLLLRLRSSALAWSATRGGPGAVSAPRRRSGGAGSGQKRRLGCTYGFCRPASLIRCREQSCCSLGSFGVDTSALCRFRDLPCSAALPRSGSSFPSRGVSSGHCPSLVSERGT